MASVVGFNFQAWVARYPEFATVPRPVAEEYFTEATIYHANDGRGPVVDDAQQLLLLGMVVAHLAARYQVVNGQIPSTLVGRITSASEGSVSVSSDFNAPGGTAQWWLTTTYGSNYWFATAPYRTMRYRANPNPRIFNPPLFGGRW